MPVKRRATIEDDPKKFAAQSIPDSFKEVAENWVKRHVDGKRVAIQARDRTMPCTNISIPKMGDTKVPRYPPRRDQRICWIMSPISTGVTGRYRPADHPQHLQLLRRPQRTLRQSPIVRGMKRVQTAGSQETPLPRRRRNQTGVGCVRSVGHVRATGEGRAPDRSTTRQARVE